MSTVGEARAHDRKNQLSIALPPSSTLLSSRRGNNEKRNLEGSATRWTGCRMQAGEDGDRDRFRAAWPVPPHGELSLEGVTRHCNYDAAS